LARISRKAPGQSRLFDTQEMREINEGEFPDDGIG
jgi:hypothetical protein